MHPALQNFELLSMISSYTHHGSLPALASTCRAFEHPALDVLWRDLQSMEPFVRCLPGNLIGIDRGHLALRKPLDANMWDTLYKYTNRVYSIRQSGNSDFIACISPLMLPCPVIPTSLFPHLRKLTWHAEGTQNAAELLRMALVPSMLFLDIRISSPSFAFLSVLSSIGTLCPHLQDMTVEASSAARDLIRKASPFIAVPFFQLNNLHKLSIWDLGNQAIEHLMQLQNLQELSLDLRASSALGTRPRTQFPGFHGLKFLRLTVDKLEQASDFLSSLQVVRSKGIDVHLMSHTPRESGSTGLSQFFDILQEKIPTKLDDFTPLHAYRNLTTLSICRRMCISTSDEELCQLVRAWPKLEALSINYYASPSTTLPTFHGLISVLCLCPALTLVSLVIDTTKLDGIDLQYPGGGICNKNLKDLDLGNSSPH
ncbi:hypothetical protein AZE42_12927 [Rhizopogon vesiculosus]|uniref:F-box domain-containing protein n=1 Tax=Rhizopogon vesiculosus TaxID=180088 RepID=A0A1J8QEL8_9AGAM|nr:hypothetical protein AZE42_12927 [Rhizopogon vesiculosus]